MDPTGLATPPAGVTVDPHTHEVTFRVEADVRFIPSRVWFHLRDYGADPTFHLEAGQWVARIPRPPVDRLEYLLVLTWPDGGESMVTDPANARRVRSVFGDKSVIEFPGYARPWWLAVADAADAQARRDAEADSAAARRAAATGRSRSRARPVSSTRMGAAGMVPVARTSTLPEESTNSADQPLGEGVASVRVGPSLPRGDDRIRRSPSAASHPSGALVVDPGTAEVVDPDAAVAVVGQLHVPGDSTPDEPLPLLVVHDGPEYDDLAQLLRYVTILARTEPSLRCRVLLLEPVDRDRSYSASPAYARALVSGMLPKVTAAVATTGRPVGMGASLGGLAMLHAAILHPGTFAGVFSQSGSFFRPRTDGMERGYRHYSRIVRFVDDLDADPQRLVDLHVTMTCGTGEENLANNRSLARRLTRQGVPTQLIENPDGHNYTGWRDCLDPGLRLLLRSAWGRAGNATG
ncbi:MAG: alpha/beta hydrolase-fold protein [Candidatus Nanopelagicales bacterium]|jgi:enterochelin esterase-like enzyme|nr:alpha/beta hydrolase-fold protein [Candidatus Nanopelagicales bacterium]